MSASSVIISDLKMCFLDGKREFDVLNAYRGVQFMCKGMLESVSENAAVLNIQSPCSVLLEAGKTTLILSSQLLDPIKATVTSFDLLTGQLNRLPQWKSR
jgi:hypothetical protein